MEDTKEVFANFKEQVRKEADIVKVISTYVPLKKKGGRYWGCCPFHGEKTPSFTVDENKGLFHCFGCGVGGDVFSFVMKQENLSFVDALKFLANKFNIPIPRRERNAKEIAQEKEAQEIYAANEWAAKFFHSCLLNTSYGKNGLAYLQKRGIGADIIARFQIGLAPDAFDKLHQGLLGKGVTAETMLKAGLANRKDKGGIYDKFRARIMIPIKNPRGKVVGFTGRVLEAQSSPAKYMNTGDTPWFHKGSILFGLDAALASIRKHKQAIVVEGHMDAISLHAAGVDWAVASMGTAFTQQQATLIKRLAPEVIFCFDSDEAGRHAAMRAIPLAQNAELKCRVMHVPEGKDPDDFVRKEGPQAFIDLIAKALPGVEYEIKTTLAAHDLTSLTGKVEAVTEVLPFIAACSSEVEIGERLRELARTLTIDEGLIQTEYRKMKGKEDRNSGSVSWAALNRPLTSAREQAERIVLSGYLHRVKLDLGDEAALYSTSSRQKIRQLAEERMGEGFNPRDLFEVLTEAEASELTNILALDIPENNLPVMVKDCLNQLELEKLEKSFQEHSQLAMAYEKTNSEGFKQELAECQRIRKKIAELNAVKREN